MISDTIIKRIFFRVLLILPTVLCSQNPTNFIHISPKEGNTDLAAYNMVQDSLGYIWLSHGNRIIKFDGKNYSFIPFESIYGDTIKNDRIKNIALDKNGHIWSLSVNGYIAKQNTKGEFNLYDSLKASKDPSKKITMIKSGPNHMLFGTQDGKIYSINHKTSKIDSLSLSAENFDFVHNRIEDIVENKKNIIWFTTTSGHVFQYNLNTKVLTKLIDAAGSSIVLDLQNRLWISNGDVGLFLYDLKTNNFNEYKTADNTSIKGLIVYMFCDSSGNVWVATDGNGVYRIDTATNTQTHFLHNDLNRLSLSSNTVVNINEDADKNIWIFPNYGSINVLPNNNNNFQYHSGQTNNAPARILSILKSTDNTLWIGTDGSGLTQVSPNGTVQHSPLSGFKGRYIQTLLETSKGDILIGTYQNGLWKYSSETKSFSKLSLLKYLGYEPSFISSLYKDSKQRIWISSSGEITVFTKDFSPLAIFKYNTNNLNGYFVQHITEDKKGNMWLGVISGGLYKLIEDKNDFKNSSFKNYSHPDTNINTKLFTNIYSIGVDSDNNLWIIASGSLYKFNTDNFNFIAYKNNNVFGEIDLKGILVSDSTNLWLSSNKGLWQYNIKKNTTNNYTIVDGLQENLFMPKSTYKDAGDNLYFGGSNGVSYFDPKKLDKKEKQASLYIMKLIF